jgi:uncharacterized membrane protein YgcG
LKSIWINTEENGFMKISKKISLSVIGLGAVVGVAFACEVLPMPPMAPLKVTMVDMPKASDYSNPANAAFMKKLDGAAEKLVGAANWRANAFHGHVAYSFKMMMMTGSALIYIEKPCDSSAEEMAQKAAQSVGSNGGGGGSGGSGGGGGGVLIGGGCYGSCGGKMPIVDVGPPQQIS